MPSLNQIASIIQNSINGGHGVTNERIRFEQIKDEVILTMHRLLDEYEKSGRLTEEDIDKMYQRVDCIALECKDIAECCNGVKSGQKVLTATIPATERIRYIGHIDNMHPYIIQKGITGIYATYGKYVKKKPTAWLRNATQLIILNPPTLQLKYITIDAIWSNPKELYQYSCVKCGDDEATDFPISNKFADLITGKLIASYLNYGQVKPLQPNTQADQV